MRSIMTLHPTEQIPAPPDSVFTFLIAGGTPQASDWQSTGSTAMATAGAAFAHIVRLTGYSTAGASLNFMANLMTTAAASPSSGFQVGSSATVPVMGQGTFQVMPGSTGFSVAALSSGYVMVEMWRK